MTSIGLAREENRIHRSVYTLRFVIQHSNRRPIPSSNNGHFGSSMIDRISDYQASAHRLTNHYVFLSLHYYCRTFPVSNRRIDGCPGTMNDILSALCEPVPGDSADITGIIISLHCLCPSCSPSIFFLFSSSVDGV